jgi:peptidoglycan/LPS O-acetylase OafA/YrhL
LYCSPPEWVELVGGYDVLTSGWRQACKRGFALEVHQPVEYRCLPFLSKLRLGPYDVAVEYCRSLLARYWFARTLDIFFECSIEFVRVLQHSKNRRDVRQQSRMKTSRVNEIDLLRLFAALTVVFYHYSFRGYAADDMSIMPYPLLAPYAKYGYLAVDLFFLISGFVILMTATGRSLRDFFASRVVRLYPAFWACCTITFVVIIAIGEPRFSASIGQYLVNLTLASGFVGVPAIDGIYWSLFVEIRFYALVAAVLLIRRIHQAQLFLILWLIASVALEIALQMLPVPMTGIARSIDVLRVLLIVDYSAFLIAGATLFLVWSEGISLTRVAIVVVSWGLALYQSLHALTAFEEHYSTKMNSYIVAAIVTIFFLVMFLVSVRRTGFIGRHRWLMAGALTYPLYLLHQTIGFMIFDIAYPRVNPHLLLWGTVIAMIVAAYAIHVLVEERLSPPLKTALDYSFDAIERLKTRLIGRSGASQK